MLLKKPIQSLRVGLARNLARALKLLGASTLGCRAIQRVRKTPVAASLLRKSLAFNQPFSSLEEAESCIRRYFVEGHDNPYHNRAHADFSEITRESDYPVLYHLAPTASELRSVFDLGGSIGNLFYSYDRELHFSPELRWMINDLPHKQQPALDFARSKGESRIAFTDRFSDASGVDLMVVVGAVHYFEEKLAVMLRRLERRPKIVVVNRSPFSNQGDLVTVQDGGRFALACKLHDAEAFVSGMVALGYELVARWPVHERTMEVPLHPELTDTYWGFFFRLKNTDSK